jgi:hypothetical protein
MVIPLAAVDSSVFAAGITAVLGGGAVAAWNAYRKTPVEVESISVATLKGVIEEMRTELERKDTQIKEQNVTIGEQQGRIDKLERAVAELQGV